MKKVVLIFALCTVAIGFTACCKCEREPIVEQNHKLIVPPDFGSKPNNI